MTTNASDSRGQGDRGASTTAEAPQFAPDSPIEKAVAAGLWAAGVAWLVPMVSSMTVLNKFVLPAERTEWLSRLYVRGQIALTGSRWRAEVDPAIDPAGRYMFLQNHVNHFDHATLYDATPHFKQGVELEEHFKYPFYGWFMESRGTIPVKKGQGGQTGEVLARMRAEVEKGHSILGFPEGTRTKNGRVGPFRKGLFFTARDLGIPIIPVAVTGMFEVMRKGSWLIRPGHEVTVHCCAPVPTAGLSDEEIPALVERVRAVIAGKVDEYYARRQGAGR